MSANTSRHPDGANGRSKRAFSTIELMISMTVIGILALIAVPSYTGYRERVVRAHTINDMKILGAGIENFRTEFGELPDSLEGILDPLPLDAWGRPFEYLNLQSGDPGVKGKRRRDKNLNPINSDYDLYSKGEDGQTTAQLVAKKSRDDIVRANDGAFMGLASEY